MIGALRVNSHCVFLFRTLDLYMPANIEVYKDGKLLLPRTVKFYNSQNNIHGRLGGITDLTLIHSSMFLSDTSMSEGENIAGRYTFANLNIGAKGVLQFLETDSAILTLPSGTLNISPTGIIRARELTVTADMISIEEGATIDLDSKGYGKEGPGIYQQFKPLLHDKAS